MLAASAPSSLPSTALAYCILLVVSRSVAIPSMEGVGMRWISGFFMLVAISVCAQDLHHMQGEGYRFSESTIKVGGVDEPARSYEFPSSIQGYGNIWATGSVVITISPALNYPSIKSGADGVPSSLNTTEVDRLVEIIKSADGYSSLARQKRMGGNFSLGDVNQKIYLTMYTDPTGSLIDYSLIIPSGDGVRQGFDSHRISGSTLSDIAGILKSSHAIWRDMSAKKSPGLISISLSLGIPGERNIGSGALLGVQKNEGGGVVLSAAKQGFVLSLEKKEVIQLKNGLKLVLSELNKSSANINYQQSKPIKLLEKNGQIFDGEVQEFSGSGESHYVSGYISGDSDSQPRWILLSKQSIEDLIDSL